MKISTGLLLLMLLLGTAYSQAQDKVMSMVDARAAGISFNNLDERYLTAYPRGKQDTSAFPGMRDSVLQTYRAMLGEMTAYLNSKRFEWGKPKRTFLRIYFDEEGSMDYFFYRFRDLEEKEEKKMKKLVGKFFKDYTFPMEAEGPFFVLAPAILRDTAKK